MTQLQQTKNAGRQHDIIVLHGGVNDAWDGIEVGEIDDSYHPVSYYDPSTFAPALEQMFSYIEDEFPDAIVCYVINFEFLNASMGLKLMEMDPYVDATIEICEKWGIEYLDLYHDEELVEMLHPRSGSTYQNTYLYDFVHPSTAGYDVLYSYINEFLIELVDPWYNDSEEDDEPEDSLPDDPNPEPDPEPTPEPGTKEEEKGGCKATLSISAVALCVLSTAVVVTVSRKRKTDDVYP